MITNTFLTAIDKPVTLEAAEATGRSIDTPDGTSQLTDFKENIFPSLFLQHVTPATQQTAKTAADLFNPIKTQVPGKLQNLLLETDEDGIPEAGGNILPPSGNILPDIKQVQALQNLLNNTPFSAGDSVAEVEDKITREVNTVQIKVKPADIANLLPDSDQAVDFGLQQNKINKIPLAMEQLFDNGPKTARQEVNLENFFSNIIPAKDDKQDIESINDLLRSQVLLNKLQPRENTTGADNQLLQLDRLSVADIKVMESSSNRPTNANPSGIVKYSIDTPMNQPQWGQTLAGRISMMIANNHHTAQININPPELGPIEVKVTVNNDQASVNFFAHHGDVRDAIEEAFPRLREMLSNSGLSLGESNVSEHSLAQERGNNQELSDFSASNLSTVETETREAGRQLTGQISIGLVDHYV